MGVEHIDVVVLHNPPPDVIGSDEHYSALEEVAQKGLIRAYGASVDTSRELDALPPAVSVTEVRLSALHQEPLPAIRPGTIVKVPLESGWLSGRYDAESTFTDVRARWSPADVALRAALVEEFHGLLPEGMSTVEGALRFLLSYPEVSTVIPGTRSLDHLAVSIAAVAEGALPRDTVDAVQSWYAERIGDRALSW
jgi:aryl-alcohol dehydrogenase-like predicted oxidoreductase